MAVEDRPSRAQESGLQEVLSGRPCWASRSVLSTHSSSALARLFPQSPPKLNEANSDTSRETTHAQSGSESSSQEAAPKKESLAESAAAYTKATAWTCLLEKVEVITGEEAESNVLQVRPKTGVLWQRDILCYLLRSTQQNEARCVGAHL